MRERHRMIAILLAVTVAMAPTAIVLANPSKTKNPPSSGSGAKSKPPKKTKEVTEADFKPYMADLQRRIKHHWFPPRGNSSIEGIVVFGIKQGGAIYGLRLERSTGVAVSDQAMLKAVENAAPFLPLPTGSPATVDISFTFDYNVFQDVAKERERERVKLQTTIKEQEQYLDREHPILAITVRDLADLHTCEGNYKEAEPLYRRALSIQEKHLPSEEQELGRTLSKLGELYYLQKRYAEAQPLYKQSLAIDERLLPSSDPILSENLERYAKLLYVSNQTNEANAVYARLKQMRDEQQKTH